MQQIDREIVLDQAAAEKGPELFLILDHGYSHTQYLSVRLVRRESWKADNRAVTGLTVLPTGPLCKLVDEN